MSPRTIIVLLLVCMVLTACGPSQPKTRELYRGTEGIKLSFPDRNNLQLFEGEEFSVAVRLENDGTSDVNETSRGFVSVVYDPSLFIFQQASAYNTVTLNRDDTTLSPLVSFTARGRSEYIEQGDVEYAEFVFKSHELSGNRDKADATLTFTACYEYTTTFINTICVDRDLYNTRLSQTCVGTPITDSSQGAPVAVTKVEPSYLRKQLDSGESVVRPQFKVTLSNVGGGNPLYSASKRAEEICEMSGFQRDEFGKVQVRAFLNNIELKCGPSSNNYDGIVKFDRNQAQILCVLEDNIEAGANYATPIIIKARYFYINSITAQLEVQS
jgi:hypothetical protein